jgi:hypothetical protein
LHARERSGSRARIRKEGSPNRETPPGNLGALRKRHEQYADSDLSKRKAFPVVVSTSPDAVPSVDPHQTSLPHEHTLVVMDRNNLWFRLSIVWIALWVVVIVYVLAH